VGCEDCTEDRCAKLGTCLEPNEDCTVFVYSGEGFGLLGTWGGLWRETGSRGYIDELFAVPIASFALPSDPAAGLIRRRGSECTAGG
jgi:hypothetical protein